MPTPVTLTRTDHAITIRVDGITVGQIHDWSPSMSRTVTPTFQLESGTSGEVFENVPGNIGGLTITVMRYDLYTKKMEQAWGSNFSINMLTDQTVALTITEKWSNPATAAESWIYKGCWFTSLGRTHSAEGDRITKVNATLAYARKDRVV
jgi:hypothetical protein